MHVELELAHAIASWGISDGRLDIEDFSSSALKLVQFRRLFVSKHSRERFATWSSYSTFITMDVTVKFFYQNSVLIPSLKFV
jgi:hypothetical protein